MTFIFNFALPLDETKGAKAIADTAEMFGLKCTEPSMYDRVHESGWKIKSAWTITVSGAEDDVQNFLNQARNKFDEVK